MVATTLIEMGWVNPGSQCDLSQLTNEMDFFHFFGSMGKCCFIHFIQESFHSFHSTQLNWISFLSLQRTPETLYFFHFNHVFHFFDCPWTPQIFQFFCVFHFFQGAGTLNSFISFVFSISFRVWGPSIRPILSFHLCFSFLSECGDPQFFHFICVFHFFQGAGTFNSFISFVFFISFRVR